VLLPHLYIPLRRAFVLDTRAAGWRAMVLTVIACGLLRLVFDVGCALILIVA
jgi:hypothetical protein